MPGVSPASSPIGREPPLHGARVSTRYRRRSRQANQEPPRPDGHTVFAFAVVCKGEGASMSIYDRFGVRTIINAKGPSTRLSGGFLDAEVSAAMAEAATYCVDMAELQAGASKVIAEITGAEAGMVTSGAA